MYRLILSFILLTVHFSISAATLEKVRFSQNNGTSRLVFDLNTDIQYKTFTLKNPDRLVIDILHARFSKKVSLPAFNRSVIQRLRHAAYDKNTLRIVLDLDHHCKYETKLLSSPYRLVIDLYSDIPKKLQNTLVHKKHKPQSVANKKLKLAKKQRPEQILRKRKKEIIIAIDPGHGGQDSGALGKHYTKEKDVTLAIARQLAKLVNKEPGMQAYLTRDRDVFIPLRHRIKLAREHHANLFISIHADSFKNPQARGASVFVLSERGASSEAAKLLADKENAADLAGGISLDDKDDLLASVLLDLSQDASLESSQEVAENILTALKRIGHVHKKYVQSAAFVVLKSPDIPSVLIETAFISNPNEEWKLKDSRHQKKLARAILSGIRSYFKHNPLPDSAQPQQHIVSQGDTLNTIAQRYQVSVTKLKQYNNLTDSQIKIGDILFIP